MPVDGTVQPPDVSVFSALAARPLMCVSFKMSTGSLTAGAGGVVGAADEEVAADAVGATDAGATDVGATDDAAGVLADDAAAGAVDEGLAEAEECVADGVG